MKINKKNLLQNFKIKTLRKTTLQTIIIFSICLLFSIISLAFFHTDYKLFQVYEVPQDPELIDFQDINIQFLKDMINSNSAILVDAREQSLFEESHIPGAISMPVSDFETKISDFLIKVPKDQTLITYCSDRNCSDSKFLSNRLLKAGYKFILIYKDGMEGWENNLD